MFSGTTPFRSKEHIREEELFAVILMAIHPAICIEMAIFERLCALLKLVCVVHTTLAICTFAISSGFSLVLSLMQIVSLCHHCASNVPLAIYFGMIFLFNSKNAKEYGKRQNGTVLIRTKPRSSHICDPVPFYTSTRSRDLTLYWRQRAAFLLAYALCTAPNEISAHVSSDVLGIYQATFVKPDPSLLMCLVAGVRSWKEGLLCLQRLLSSDGDVDYFTIILMCLSLQLRVMGSRILQATSFAYLYFCISKWTNIVQHVDFDHFWCAKDLCLPPCLPWYLVLIAN